MTRFNVSNFKSGPYLFLFLVTLVCCLVLILVTIHPPHVMGNPPSVSERELEHQAQTAYDNGNYSTALQYLYQILKTKPTVRILTAMGSTLNELGNYSGALSFYRQALQLDPHHVGALLGMAATLDLLGNRTAVVYLKEALAQPVSATGNDRGKLDRALTFTHLKNYTQAMSVVDQVLKAHPTYTDALNAKGVILLYQNNARANRLENSFTGFG